MLLPNKGDCNENRYPLIRKINTVVMGNLFSLMLQELKFRKILRSVVTLRRQIFCFLRKPTGISS